MFVIAVNRTSDPLSVWLAEFAVVSLDQKQPNNPNKAKVIVTISPAEVAQETALMFRSTNSPPPPSQMEWLIYDKRGRYAGQAVSYNPLASLIRTIQEEEDRLAAEMNRQEDSTMINWIARTAFSGGVISPGGHLYGILYFPKIGGVNPMLMYSHKEWAQTASLKLPLGNWINSRH